MLQVPMEIVGPVLGIVSIIGAITASVLTLRWFSVRLPKPPAPLDPGQAQLLEELQYKVAELDDLKRRLMELEERQDFTERLLTKPPA
jgi:hypothetical protein